MKKISSLLLVGMMVFALAACSGGEAKKEETITAEEFAESYDDLDEIKGKTVEIGFLAYDVEKTKSETEVGFYLDEYDDPVIAIVEDTSFKVKKDSYYKIKGTIGTYSGENYMAYSSSSVPKIVVESIEESNYVDVVTPTIKTVHAQEDSVTQNKLTITVDKIELAENETRVYITVDNKNAQGAFLYLDNNIVQNNKQYKCDFMEYNAEYGEYKEIYTDIRANVTVKGIIIFDAIELDDDFNLSIKLDLDDYSIDDEFEFSIKM